MPLYDVECTVSIHLVVESANIGAAKEIAVQSAETEYDDLRVVDWYVSGAHRIRGASDIGPTWNMGDQPYDRPGGYKSENTIGEILGRRSAHYRRAADDPYGQGLDLKNLEGEKGGPATTPGFYGRYPAIMDALSNAWVELEAVQHPAMDWSEFEKRYMLKIRQLDDVIEAGSADALKGRLVPYLVAMGYDKDAAARVEPEVIDFVETLKTEEATERERDEYEYLKDMGR